MPFSTSLEYKVNCNKELNTSELSLGYLNTARTCFWQTISIKEAFNSLPSVHFVVCCTERHKQFIITVYSIT